MKKCILFGREGKVTSLGGSEIPITHSSLASPHDGGSLMMVCDWSAGLVKWSHLQSTVTRHTACLTEIHKLLT